MQSGWFTKFSFYNYNLVLLSLLFETRKTMPYINFQFLLLYNWYSRKLGIQHFKYHQCYYITTTQSKLKYVMTIIIYRMTSKHKFKWKNSPFPVISKNNLWRVELASFDETEIDWFILYFIKRNIWSCKFSPTGKSAIIGIYNVDIH